MKHGSAQYLDQWLNPGLSLFLFGIPAVMLALSVFGMKRRFMGGLNPQAGHWLPAFFSLLPVVFWSTYAQISSSLAFYGPERVSSTQALVYALPLMYGLPLGFLFYYLGAWLERLIERRP